MKAYLFHELDQYDPTDAYMVIAEDLQHARKLLRQAIELRHEFRREAIFEDLQEPEAVLDVAQEGFAYSPKPKR